jgi:pimeloyl-ACP methyl ester carboxylesterase
MNEETLHSDVKIAIANEIEIAYDTFGDPQGQPIVLNIGWGGQLIHWEEEFCQLLSSEGFWVIRYDYRDVGLSAKLDALGVPDIGQLQEAIASGKSVQAPYTMFDMALDLVGLLDALEIESAHLLGKSMGTAIASLVAIHYPERVKSLILIGASTDDPKLPSPPPEVLSVLLKPSPSDRDGFIDSYIEKSKATHGIGLPFDEDRERYIAGLTYDRGLHPDGRTRQLAANLATGSLKEKMKSITAPSLVIFGRNDPFGLEHGIDTAETIPGAELLIIDGMGHTMPSIVWPQIVEAIAHHTHA